MTERQAKNEPATAGRGAAYERGAGGGPAGGARRLDPGRAEAFILANTSVLRPPHVPEIALRLASEAHEIWLKTEEELAELGLPPPFWAFAWAGGQGLARYLLDHPFEVAGRRVVDFASGSGLVAIAAAMAEARGVLAADIDPFAATALSLNLALNGREPGSPLGGIGFSPEDLVGRPLDADILLAGDVFYDRQMADAVIPWFEAEVARGVRVIVGDPGRAYLPKHRLDPLAEYRVPVSRALEDQDVKRVTVWEWRG
ncbi:methyltransferase [Jiella endophytica]|uniref:Methyltransferase n=1 Tax=Jiella endophytica TaxID=2558362 RepID=A0A4Y8R7R6_9HYPH|nr:methyltransferase [Jiella endophytica]